MLLFIPVAPIELIIFMSFYRPPIPSIQLRENAAKQTLQEISERDYQHFLKEETHQLKKLLLTIKSTKRTVSSCTNTIQPPTCRSRINYEQIIEFTDSDMRAMTADHASRKNNSTIMPRKPNKSPRQGRLKLPEEYYRQRKREIQQSLYVGGRGYVTARNIGKVSLQTMEERSAVEKRQPTGKELAFRLQMSLRKHKKDRYTLASSR